MLLLADVEERPGFSAPWPRCLASGEMSTTMPTALLGSDWRDTDCDVVRKLLLGLVLSMKDSGLEAEEM